MTLPIDLVLVRHGQSEGNAAKRRSEAGDNSAFTPDFRARHTASFRLTDKGRGQAFRAGTVIRELFFKEGLGFDRYVTSEYTRAMETAGNLALPDAEWFCDFNLTERDWGELDVLPEDERDARYGENIRKRDVEPFFWRPAGGETFAQLCLRVDRALDTLHRECSDKRVIVVCHGEVMRAFQVRIERMSQVRFKEVVQSERSEDKIFNCQLTHYTRRNPETGKLAPHANWVRFIRPTVTPYTVSKWRTIERPRYSNSDLLEVVGENPLMVA